MYASLIDTRCPARVSANALIPLLTLPAHISLNVQIGSGNVSGNREALNDDKCAARLLTSLPWQITNLAFVMPKDAEDCLGPKKAEPWFANRHATSRPG